MTKYVQVSPTVYIVIHYLLGSPHGFDREVVRVYVVRLTVLLSVLINGTAHGGGKNRIDKDIQINTNNNMQNISYWIHVFKKAVSRMAVSDPDFFLQATVAKPFKRT